MDDRPADHLPTASAVAYSDSDVAGRTLVLQWMREAGLDPRIDAAGNIFGRRAGSDPKLEPVLFGSHTDSVPSGGNFDGDLGVLSSIEVVEWLNANRIQTRRPLEVVDWCNEEGVAFDKGFDGSRAVAGLLEEGELEHVWNGVTKRDAIRKSGATRIVSHLYGAQRAPFMLISSSTSNRVALWTANTSLSAW